MTTSIWLAKPRHGNGTDTGKEGAKEAEAESEKEPPNRSRSSKKEAQEPSNCTCDQLRETPRDTTRDTKRHYARHQGARIGRNSTMEGLTPHFQPLQHPCRCRHAQMTANTCAATRLSLPLFSKHCF